MNSNPTRTGLAVALVALTSGVVIAQSVVDRPPNIKPLPASNLSLVTNSAGGLSLRFATTTWNAGTGPLELAAGSVETGSGKQQVHQNVFRSDGSSYLRYAGSFTYHPEHNHIHFDDYALYTLQPVNAPGGSSRVGQKTTFCVMDTYQVNATLPGSPSTRFYSSCGRILQGMSVGWGDTYGAHLAGQEIDFTNNADGIYALRIEVDPKKLLVETNENDNVSCVLLSVRKPGTVSVLDASGQCSTVTAIAPGSVATGASVQVTISGYGFTPGMAVGFEGGNGSRPVASNVQLVSDTDSLDQIAATVTVPYKKNPGRDPVWDVRVGTGGVLYNGFTVTR